MRLNRLKQRWIVAALYLAVVSAFNIANGQQKDSTNLALNLGNILASEEFCGLSYSQEAISAFVGKHVREDDMGFASELQMMTDGSRVELQQMSASAKTAQCAQTMRVARAFGFIK